MRLWHKDLISVLPQKQLLAQWRECCAIASNIANKGTPNHILVNKVLNYPVIHFSLYSNMIIKEIQDRGYRISKTSYSNFVINLTTAKNYFACDFSDTEKMLIKTTNDLYKGWMNKRYLTQCYYNLQEKYDCGAISDEDMNKIFQVYESKIGTRMYKV